MLKKLVVIIALILPITACEKIGDFLIAKFESSLPSETSSQRIKSEKLFAALHQPHQDSFLVLVEENVRDAMLADPELFSRMKKLIPAGQPSAEAEVIQRMANTRLGEGKTTTIVYKYDYPQKELYMSVVFAGHDGDDKVKGFWLENAAEKESDDLVTEITSDADDFDIQVDEASTVTPTAYS
ncbi:hypothetical protein [Acinetobacter sp. YH01005]|uniref:hypothetical protein n=1 Tax=Acinetobacter sp. YH01005 TaxID=2601021 RepID=UPI0015D198CF|nr:hypothetical protein [Acinetobacter sp. YH01005]